MARGKLVEQLPLHISARQAVQFLLYLHLHQLFQLVEAFEAEGFGHFIVKLCLGGPAHFADDNVKGRCLAGQILRTIIFGEGHVDDLVVVGFEADHLVFKTRDQLARTQFDRHPFAFATIEGHTIDLALEIDDDHVADRCLIGFWRCFEAFLPRHQFFKRGIDFAAFGFDGQPLEFQIVDRDLGNRRQNFEMEIDHCILAWRIIIVEMDMRLRCGAQLVVRDGFLHAVLDRAVQRILHQRFAVHFLHQIGRHLAGAEAGHAHLRGDFLHLIVDPRLNIGGSDGHPVSPLQAFILGFLRLHVFKLYSLKL